MLISEMISTVLSEFNFYTTNEVLNKVNNLYELNLKYNVIHSGLTELKYDGVVKKRVKHHLEEWMLV